MKQYVKTIFAALLWSMVSMPMYGMQETKRSAESTKEVDFATLPGPLQRIIGDYTMCNPWDYIRPYA